MGEQRNVFRMPLVDTGAAGGAPTIVIQQNSPEDTHSHAARLDDSESSFEDKVRAISQAQFQPDSDNETIYQELNLAPTTLKEVYEYIENEDESRNLARYLPAKIVQETRNKFRDSLRLGRDQDGFEALEDGLEVLRKQTMGEDSDYWKFSQAEILLDLGKKDEARELLAHCGRRTTETRARSARKRAKIRTRADADADYAHMLKLAKQEELLDLSLRAESWEAAIAAAGRLYRINPGYFHLETPMDRFQRCRQLFNLGLLAEIQDPKSDVDRTRRFLGKALRFYNHGCYAIELFHEYFDQPNAIVNGFDHVDCANLFFSAARICIFFDKIGIFDKRGNPLGPAQFNKMFKRTPLPCTPLLTEKDWRHQALQFLEQGRSRALLDSIVRGERVVTSMQRRLLIDDFVFAAQESIRVQRRDDSKSSLPASRSSSMSGTSSPLESSDILELAGQDQGEGSDTPTQSTLITPLNHRFRTSPPLRPTLNTANLDEFAILDSPYSSPVSAVANRCLSEEEKLRKLRIRMRWRKVLLYAFAISNPTLNAALPNASSTRDVEAMRKSLPRDTAAIVYSLVSAAPTGIMMMVVTSHGIIEALWQETNVLVIQKQIAQLRDSMVAPNSRTRDMCQPSPTSSRRDSLVPDAASLEASLMAALVLPIQHSLFEKSNLIVIPSGDLAHVPWALLFGLPVTVVPSLSIWNRLHSHSYNSRPVQTKVSVVSNAPNDEQGFLRDIPYSRIEAFYVAKLHQQLPFISDHHDRAEFDKEAESTQVLHLCAHSSFDHENPMRSSIQLFKEPMTIEEWHSLAIKADLVVFSSCLSGVSRAFDSGSTFGFAHTLLATGTQAFIGSLWPVEDDATLLLMMMFYEDLHKEISPSQALHNAQQKMKTMTESRLFELVTKLQLQAKNTEEVSQYVVSPNYTISRLANLSVAELKEARCWAAFILTGYGFKPIYGDGSESDATAGADRD
ncbi:hypothetical protein FKW77_005973 [Venturia effusa]|uniref:CHAT domain-containing protein n=1 Tax=Venturia effusa TaxID=50376 RepID=A0A517KZI7_9PEZI|nr:hypothetical protein FKW77_005973 [Venturia effusa]